MRQTQKIQAPYRLSEEIFHSISHGIGWALSIAGLTLLCWKAVRFGNAVHLTSAIIFGTSLVLLFAASTMYHGLSFRLKAKAVFKRLDHCAIYLLIAGTYTPVCLVTLKGEVGNLLLLVVWSFALVGVLMKAIFVHRFKIASTLLMILMGWAVILVYQTLLERASEGLVQWLWVGGLAYTIGILFYAMKRWPWMHAIWHAFVLVGALSHFFMIYFYVIPKTSVV